MKLLTVQLPPLSCYFIPLLLLPGFYSPFQAKTALTMPLHRILSDAISFAPSRKSFCLLGHLNWVRPAGIDSGFLTMSFLWGGVVILMPNPQPGGPGLCIYNPQREGGPVIPPGTGYPSWSPLTTRMSYGGAILFPNHHTGILHPSLVQRFSSEPCSQTPSAYALPLM
jgi:hypothetical protein